MFTQTLRNKNPTGTEAEVSEPLDKTRAFELLSASRRQTILRLLAEHGPMDKTELGDRAAEAEFGLHYNSTERKRVYVAMIQCHLPKLADHDAIEVTDNRVRMKEFGGKLRQIDGLVERHMDDSRTRLLSALL